MPYKVWKVRTTWHFVSHRWARDGLARSGSPHPCPLSSPCEVRPDGPARDRAALLHGDEVAYHGASSYRTPASLLDERAIARRLAPPGPRPRPSAAPTRSARSARSQDPCSAVLSSHLLPHAAPRRFQVEGV